MPSFLKLGGGLRPVALSLSLASTARQLSITESVGGALPYRRMASAKTQDKARRRAAVAADFFAVLATDNSQLKEQARKEVAPATDTAAKSKAAGDQAAGHGASSSFQAAGRGSGRGRGGGSSFGHQGAMANSTNALAPWRSGVSSQPISC